MATVKQLGLLLSLFAVTASSICAQDHLQESIVPILEDHCFDCHAGGGEEGGVTFDHLVDDEFRRIEVIWQRGFDTILPPRSILVIRHV